MLKSCFPGLMVASFASSLKFPATITYLFCGGFFTLESNSGSKIHKKDGNVWYREFQVLMYFVAFSDMQCEKYLFIGLNDSAFVMERCVFM